MRIYHSSSLQIVPFTCHHFGCTKDPAKIAFRTFSTDVVIRGSKWSRDANIFIFDKQ